MPEEEIPRARITNMDASWIPIWYIDAPRYWKGKPIPDADAAAFARPKSVDNAVGIRAMLFQLERICPECYAVDKTLCGCGCGDADAE